MHQNLPISRMRLTILILIIAIGTLLAGCIAPIPLISEGDAAPAATAEPQPEAEEEVAPETADDPSAAVEPEAQPPMIAPAQISIPDLGLDLPVTPMGWQVAVVDNVETTTWIVPDDSLGWQVNSAGAGEAGNMIVAGHQALGDALLAPLALDEIIPGQLLVVTDDTGATFDYRITEVSAPLPIVDASEDEAAQAAAYAKLDGDARLTLISGWPDFTTTHRVFAVAELVNAAD